MIVLGDMRVLARPPAKLAKALAVIAAHLHQGFNADPGIIPDKSRESCVLCSLAVRDFLQRIGFADARVKAVATVMRAEQGGRELHSLGMGVPFDKTPEPWDRWSGHLVVTLPGWLIDTTLYRSIRPQWPDLTGMMALPIPRVGEGRRLYGLRPITGAEWHADDGTVFTILWLANPKNDRWRKGGDAEPVRRVLTVERMVAAFHPWEDRCAAAT